MRVPQFNSEYKLNEFQIEVSFYRNDLLCDVSLIDNSDTLWGPPSSTTNQWDEEDAKV